MIQAKRRGAGDVVVVVGAVAGVVFVLLALGAGFSWLGRTINGVLPNVGDGLQGWGSLFAFTGFAIVVLVVAVWIFSQARGNGGL